MYFQIKKYVNVKNKFLNFLKNYVFMQSNPQNFMLFFFDNT